MAWSMREHRDQVERAMRRFERTLAAADEKARNGTVAVTSPDESVRVQVGGDLHVRQVALRPGCLQNHDEDSLGQAIVETYNNALTVMQQAQMRLIRDAFRQDLKKG